MLTKIVTSLVATALLTTAAQAQPRPTSQDARPEDFPANYSDTFTRILDMTSDLNMPPVFFDTTFRNLINQRQFNSFRAVVREMLELQTKSDPLIRTRDLANPFTTSLSSFCSYYHQLGIDQPGCIKEEPIVLTPPPQPVPPPPAARPAPRPPVPALW